MKKMPKWFGLVVSLCFMMSLAFPSNALAVDVDSSASDNLLAATMTAGAQATFDAGDYNEYDYILRLQTSTSKELTRMGLSSQKATTIVDSFYDALDIRASLTDDNLKGLGYTASEIEILRAYANGARLTDDEMRAVTGTCTGSFERHSVGTTTAEFSYTWTWDHCPIITLSDASALTWLVYESDGDLIGVEQTSKTLTVNYAYQGNGTSTGEVIAFSFPGTEEQTLEFNTINMQFPVYRTKSSPSGIIFDCFAKSGTVKVAIRVPTGVAQTINHIFVGGLYGHTTIGIGSPTVSIGSEVSISFSGNTSIDPVGGRKATLYRTSSTINYWNE